MFMYSEMVADEAVETKSSSKLIEQTVGTSLTMKTIRANNLIPFNKWLPQHALLRR